MGGKMYKCGFYLAFFLIIAGCARPSAEEIASANYGPMPMNEKEIAEEWVKSQLIDPYSAQFEQVGFRKGYTSVFGTTKFGWVYCGRVNAKNRMGGYTGRSAFFTTIQYGVVVQGLIDSHDTYMAANICRQLVSG